MIESYVVEVGNDNYIVRIMIAGGDSQRIQYNDAATFSAVVDVLRNEKPVYYSYFSGLISTAPEAVGEGEAK